MDGSSIENSRLASFSARVFWMLKRSRDIILSALARGTVARRFIVDFALIKFAYRWQKRSRTGKSHVRAILVGHHDGTGVFVARKERETASNVRRVAFRRRFVCDAMLMQAIRATSQFIIRRRDIARPSVPRSRLGVRAGT